MGSDPPNDSFLSRIDFMHLPVGEYVIGREGRFLGCNEGARAILGLARDEPVEARIQDFHPL